MAVEEKGGGKFELEGCSLFKHPGDPSSFLALSLGGHDFGEGAVNGELLREWTRVDIFGSDLRDKCMGFGGHVIGGGARP